MATASIDDYAVPTAEAVSEFETSAPAHNIGLAVLKRWPWIVVGVVSGVVLGMLFHTQRPPIYQSNAQLLVIKNRTEMVTGAGGERAVAYVEDYVTTQVTLLRSQSILSVAASRLQESQLQFKPPASEKDRVDFMLGRFGVTREREQGSAQPTNVLALTFRSGNPGDSAQYLRTIIDAYRAQLAGIYEEASTKEAQRLATNIASNNNELTKITKGKMGIEELTREIESISHEDLGSMRNRLSLYIRDKEEATKRLEIIDNQLAVIATAGPQRQNRLNILIGFGQKIQEKMLNGLQSQSPEDVRLGILLQKQELSQKWGKDHPEIQTLDSKLRMLEQIIARDRPDEKIQLDELGVYQRLIEQERIGLRAQIESVTARQLDVEKKIERVSDYSARRDSLGIRAKELAKQVDEWNTLQTQMLNARSTGGYKVEDITKPSDGVQVSPILYQSVLFGLFLGLAVGLGLALSMELSDRSFRSPEEIRKRLGLPILGHIPRIRVDEPVERQSALDIEHSLVTFYRPTSTEAEAYRGVRTQLYFSTQGRGHQVIQVTSPNPGDGKSTLAANLAISIAQSGKRVVLIDCDFRKPRVHKIFKLPKPEVGLASVMTGEAELMSAVQASEVENLSLMPCGPRPANPAELLTSPKFSEVLKMLRERFDFVIVDTPPILAVSDPSAVAPRVDGVLMVFRMTKNARPVAERAREQLSAVGAHVLGVIVNASNTRQSGYGGYGYTYQYEYQYQYAESYADQDPA